jgi:hypothetical protein
MVNPTSRNHCVTPGTTLEITMLAICDESIP